LISGIDSTAFSTFVYNPSNAEVSDSVSESIIELGNGSYKYLFTPDSVGTWYVVLTHPVYFPWGKLDDVQVYTSDFSAIAADVKKTLGLVHHNFYIDDPTFDESGNMIAARIRIYSDAVSVGTNTNVIETYRIEVDPTGCGTFNYWKQVVSP
jgi:hypothetical protein